MSLVLRHKPGAIGINLDENGWADVGELIEGIRRKGHACFEFATLEEVVATNNKQRFSFNADCTKIRANQGHSLKADVELPEATPPVYLYHGTATRFLDSIMQDGLVRKSRLHVHLSLDKKTAMTVGSRHGNAVVLSVRAREMHRAGHKFYLSVNGVWLTDSVPVRYIGY